MDEPFSALDVPTRSAIMRDLSRIIAKNKTTLLFITHHPAEVPILAERLLSMDQGRIIEDAGYMAGVRKIMRKERFPVVGDESPLAVGVRLEFGRRVHDLVVAQLREEMPSSSWIWDRQFSISFPWSRPFEIEVS